MTKTRKLKSPWAIQQFVSQLPYPSGEECRSVACVLKNQKAHCMEGALTAAWYLEKLGHEPRLLHLRAHRDDDHCVAVFQVKGRWGAIGKSNTTLLTWRDPVYRSLEALAMSYFPFYFNPKGQMSLCAWAGPIRLSRYEKWNWKSSDLDIGEMSPTFYDREKEHEIMSPDQIERLPRVEARLVKACFLGANLKGLYGAKAKA